jgi:hypothetical protein
MISHNSNYIFSMVNFQQQVEEMNSYQSAFVSAFFYIFILIMLLSSKSKKDILD